MTRLLLFNVLCAALGCVTLTTLIWVVKKPSVFTPYNLRDRRIVIVVLLFAAVLSFWTAVKISYHVAAAVTGDFGWQRWLVFAIGAGGAVFGALSALLLLGFVAWWMLKALLRRIRSRGSIIMMP